MDTERTYCLADLKEWAYPGTALAVIGQPIRHSLSPIMHNAAIGELKQGDKQYKEWAYFRFEIDPKDLSEALELFHLKRFLGLNLTVPHKVMALDWITAISDSAKAIGAVNTLKRTISGYEGYNTDGYGMRQGIERGLDQSIRGSDILILGAGGAARAAVVECLSQQAASIQILNRSKDRLDTMLASLSGLEGCGSIIPMQAKEDLANLPKTGICINATSLGLNSNDPLPLDLSLLTRDWAVYDMVYNPKETQLFIEAKKLGCSVATGLGMLVHQGAKALEIWTGERIDAQIMYKAGENALYNNVNE